MATLQELLGSPETAGVWNLVPDRSMVVVKNKSMWGVVPVKVKFSEFSGDGQVTGSGAVLAGWTSGPRRCTPGSKSATSISGRPTASTWKTFPTSA